MKHLEKIEDFKTRKEVKEFDIFDFNNIPMSELDKAYIDYEPLYDIAENQRLISWTLSMK